MIYALDVKRGWCRIILSLFLFVSCDGRHKHVFVHDLLDSAVEIPSVIEDLPPMTYPLPQQEVNPLYLPVPVDTIPAGLPVPKYPFGIRPPRRRFHRHTHRPWMFCNPYQHGYPFIV